MLLVSSYVPVSAWLCCGGMRFQSIPTNWLLESPVVQWLEHPTKWRSVVGSDPIWDPDFSQYSYVSQRIYTESGQSGTMIKKSHYLFFLYFKSMHYKFLRCKILSHDFAEKFDFLIYEFSIRLPAIAWVKLYNKYTMSPSWIWSDKITTERVARVGYNHFISNKGERNNCFGKFSNRVLPAIFISTILQSVRKENLAHYFPCDVKLRLLAHSRSFSANQKARNAIVGAENLLTFVILGVSMWNWVLASELEENTDNTRNLK